jgi:nitrogen fixation NifU-like protein
MDQLYREFILDHYKHPHNFGKLKSATVVASDNLISCGDSLEIQLVIKKNKVAEIAFNGIGCAISTASASLLSDHVKGMSLTRIKKLTKDDVLQLLGISLGATRLKCALLSLEVLHKAVNKAQV